MMSTLLVHSKEDNLKGEERKGSLKEKKEEVEPKTGVAFPLCLEDGKQLDAVGVRKKKVLGINFKIYAFEKPGQELYDLVINSDIEMMVRLVIVFKGLTMGLVKKQFDEGLGASVKKLSGEKHEGLMSKVMEGAKDNIKLPARSVIEISRLPGFIMQTKVKDEVVGRLESELLCRAYISMYLGDEPLDSEAKESFGMALYSLFSPITK